MIDAPAEAPPAITDDSRRAGAGTEPAATMDPRMRARRVAVQRERGRRRLRALIVLAAFVVAVGSTYLVVQSPLLDVDRVRVTGTELLDPARVRDAAGVARGAPLLRVDTGAVARRVGALPAVAHAEVHRDLPGTLVVTVTERVPVAYVRRPDGTATLVADDGTALGAVLVPPGGLVQIIGVRRVPEAGSVLSPPAAAGARDAMPPDLAARVAAIVLSEGGTIALRLVDGAEVRLGPPDDLVAKGAAALAVLESIGPDVRVDYVDVAVPSVPALRTVDR